MAYNPAAVDRSGEIMAAGISRAGQSITDTINQKSAELKRNKALRGAAVDIFNIPPEEADKMSADDIEAHMKGMVLKQTLDEAKQRQQDAADRAAMQRQTLADQTDQQARFQNFIALLSPNQPGVVGPPAPMNAQRMLEASQKSGYRLDPREMIQMMREGGDQTDWNNVMPREFEVGGVKGAVGKSGQFQFLPSATPDSLTAIPVMDDQGNVIGQRVPTARGGSAPLPAPKGPKEVPASFFEPYHKATQNAADAEQGAARTDEELKAMATAGTPAEKRKRYQEAAKSAKQAVKRHLDLYRSQGYGTPEFWAGLYQQNGFTAPAAPATPAALSGAGSGAAGRLTVEKDGKRFTLPASQRAEAEKQGYTIVKE